MKRTFEKPTSSEQCGYQHDCQQLLSSTQQDPLTSELDKETKRPLSHQHKQDPLNIRIGDRDQFLLKTENLENLSQNMKALLFTFP